MSPRVAITIGDPRGIGPEIVDAVLRDPPGDIDFVVVGPDQLVERLPAEAVGVGSVSDDSSSDETPSGIAAETAGRLAGRAIETAASLALAGSVDAVVTGPVEKKALHLAGHRYPGQTEWLAQLAGGVEVAMMLAVDSLRVVLITTHIPLKDVPGAITVDRIVRCGRVTIDGLKERFGISDPRIALCALNPHAGEGGLFGNEETEVIEPAARALGAAGPLPADTVFVRALRGEFDAVLTPAHDVGMTAVKVAGFGRAVNVTLGLPFVRTAPDHGTAFDIVGQGKADPSSMREAVRMAAVMAARRP